MSAPLFEVHMQGLDEFESSTSAAVKDIERMHEGNERASAHLAAAARDTAPYLTGTLSGSVFAEVDPGVAIVGTPLLYGSVQEFGSTRINVPARRWMRAALQQAEPQVLDDMSAGMQHSLDKVRGV